jgi:periplasmic protein TonB
MIEQPKMAEPEIKEEAPVEEPKEAPPEDSSEPPPMGPLGLDQAPEGPGDQFNLAGNPGGRGFTGGGGGGGSRWGWYCTIIQQQIEAAMRANAKTRSISVQVEVRIWADASGRVQRVLLNPSTGDQSVDAAIRGEVLSGLVLREPPPRDMPMPIVARITARRTT